MNVFVARQPIFDRRGKLFAYELLFREGTENYFSEVNGDLATGQLISSSFSMGLRQITGGKKAFINFTGNLLKKDLATLLPRSDVVIEILETVEPNADIVEACRKLKKSGYLLALDDFVLTPEVIPLIDCVDIIKVDFLAADPSQRKKLIDCFGAKVKFLAEKVETLEDYQMALDLGYQYFQGYYFSKPVIIQGKDIPINKMTSLRLLKEVYRPGFNVGYLEQLIQSDVSISYRLLKFINSSIFGFKSQISSIRQALTLLGPQEFKRWVSLVVLGYIGEGKPHELLVQSYVRATFAEAIALELGWGAKSSDVFLMGLFSLIDAILDRPLAQICRELPLAEEVKQALLGRSNPYREMLELISSYEKGNWENTVRCAEQLKLSQIKIPLNYVKSLEKANRFLAEVVA